MNIIIKDNNKVYSIKEIQIILDTQNNNNHKKDFDEEWKILKQYEIPGEKDPRL